MDSRLPEAATVSKEVQQTHPLLFRSALIARSVTQKPFAHLSLALKANFGDLCYDLAKGAPHEFQGCAKPP